jgi:phenylpyruvate tautomerase PptA (4-oxalocrotonate tautomerase family)
MPNIQLKIPQGAFPGDARTALLRNIIDAAATAENIPDDPRKRALCWVAVEETPAGTWVCGSPDMSARLLPCFAVVYVPAGVLTAAARAYYMQLLHAAFQQALPAGESRRLVTSIVLHDVADGHWGVDGALWKLPDFVRAAGYGHLQTLEATA